MGHTIVRATAISSMDPGYKESIFKFTSGLCHTNHVEIILAPSIKPLFTEPQIELDEDLAERKLFQLRDALETRVRLEASGSPRACVLVEKACGWPGHPAYDQCIRGIRSEKECVSGWELFCEIHAACVMPDDTVKHEKDFDA